MINKNRSAFTLVEVMIVTGIIALILAIALPNYLGMIDKANKYTCIVNMYVIEGAVDAWAIANSIPKGASISSDQASGVIAYLQGTMPKCPSGGTYTLHQVGVFPQVTCSREDLGHILEEVGPGVKPSVVKTVSGEALRADEISAESVQKTDVR